MKKGCLITVLVVFCISFVLCLGIIGINREDEPTPTKKLTQSVTQAPTKSPISPKKKKENVLKATVLAADYAANELAADEKYKGKEFTIVGVVESVGKVFGSTSVTLTGDGFLYSINCSIDKKQESRVAELVKGEEVSIIGTVKGYGISIDVEDCTIK